ncbi:MAG: hypothetical protein HN353_08130 [Bdellovibrionales bacterium]|nr:hypothetical protein [Bdellovibrionales bacterium]MBT3525888.1 hypothetical protein [Bdellovibrionales bacterium]MBT7669851.1 hypothetical protein [Bdellovibrionales bacterium]MBT7766120.1 hypothetical protein [Bdellovibrionales bacterium]
MKLVLILAITIFSTTLYSECQINEYYRYYGWVIHQPSDFDKLLPIQFQKISDGLDSGQVISDLDGHLETNQGRSSDETLLMRITTWDNLETERIIMYGDFAIFANAYDPEQIYEIRWFDGEKKHIVINPTYLKCISIIPPVAINVIF